MDKDVSIMFLLKNNKLNVETCISQKVVKHELL